MPASEYDDTIEVRPGERFDEDRLAAYLRDQLPGADQPLTVRQFGGGKANLTYLLDYGSHQYVLRRPPLGPVAEKAHDMKREYTVLSRLHEAYPLAPEAYLYCPDEDVIGADFFIMERRRGVVIRETMPEAFVDIDDAPPRASRALIDALVELHAVDYEAIGLGELGQPDGFIERQIEGWYRRWHAAKTAELESMDGVYHWLKEHTPSDARAALVHNDYKLDNLMLADDDPARAVAVFDWDMCTLGDPLSDLGALLTYWAQPDDPAPFRQIAMMPIDGRFPSRAELVERYTAQSGRDVSDIHFYHALGLYRLTVIIAQIYIRYKRGQTQDERFAHLDEMVPVTAQAAYAVAQGKWP